MMVYVVMVCLECMVYISNQIYLLCVTLVPCFLYIRPVYICDVVSPSVCCKNAEVGFYFMGF